MTGHAAWLDWDGRCLRWQIHALPDTPRIELKIDGVVFERVAARVGVESRDFAYSPTGNADLEFSLHDENGAALTAAWRIRIGHAAALNEQRAEPAPPMKPIPTRKATRARRAVAIVVPVFNAVALVERCIESVIHWTAAPAQLIVIDDASTDPAVVAMLGKYAGYSNVSIYRNAENLGYTKSSNLGIAYAGTADVTLLNSDTQVGPRWLDRLVETAYSDASIGTVTAVSDNAGAFSVPELEQFCPIPQRWTLQQTQRALLQYVACPHPELPTGNGFCMFIKRAMLDDVGVLDAAAFPFGYGEENDVCQRAERAGYRHVIAGDVFVAHARSASFGDARRAELGARGMEVLRQRYPDYEAKVGATLFGFARRVLDYRVRRIYADSDRAYEKNPPRARWLRVVSDVDRISADFPDSVEGFAACGETVIALHRHVDGQWREIDRIDADAIAGWLVEWSIECISANTDAAARWREIAEKVAIPFADCPDSAIEMELGCREAWNSLAAFRSC